VRGEESFGFGADVRVAGYGAGGEGEGVCETDGVVREGGEEKSGGGV
jgi:hypothetical protein